MKEVSVRGCSNYEYNQVNQSFEKLIKDLGGIDKYINKNSTVFIKLNFVIKKDPKEMATTHPMVLKVVAKHLLNHGCKVIVGDSSGGPYTKATLNALYKTCGIEEVCEELNIELNYDISEIKVNHLQGKMPMIVRSRYESMLDKEPEKMREMIENFDEALSHPNTDDFIGLNSEALKVI